MSFPNATNMFSPIPFALGNSPYSPPLAAATVVNRTRAYVSPMARLITNRRSSPKFPHVNPHALGTNFAGRMNESSMFTVNALTSVLQLSETIDEAAANIKDKLSVLNQSGLRTEFFTSVMGLSVRSQLAQRNSAKAPIHETYEVIEGQVHNKGMFEPEYRNDHIKGWVGEFESWERMYPRKYKGEIPTGFGHLSNGDQQKLRDLLMRKDKEAYQCVKAVGQEARRQGLRLATQTAEHILLTAEAGHGVFRHVLTEHESWLVKIADGCADADKNIQAMIQSTPDLNLQHKRNTELMRVEEMIIAVAQGVRNKNDMNQEADKCDKIITDLTYSYRNTMTDEQQKVINKNQDKRTMFLKEANRCTTNIVQAVTGTQLQPRSDQIKTEYRIAFVLPDNFQLDKGKLIWTNAKASILTAAHIYYTLIPYLIRMNDFCPATAVFCKPPAEDDVERDASGNLRSVPYHDVPECMVEEYVQQDKQLYGEVIVLLRDYPDLIARLHGEFRYGMHENRIAKVMQESGINMIWGLMTMFRPAGAEHRMKVEMILNQMHDKFTTKQRPHEVIDEHRKYLNEAIELGIKLKWLTTGQRIVTKVSVLDSMFAAMLGKYLEEDTELDDAGLKLDRLFTDINRISRRIFQKDNDSMVNERHPQRLLHITDHYETYPYTGNGDDLGMDNDNNYFSSDLANNTSHGYFVNRDGRGGSQWKAWGGNGQTGNYKGGKGNAGMNTKGYSKNNTKGSSYGTLIGKGGRGADLKGKSNRIKLECEAMRCEVSTAVGHFCLRHYRELVTEQKIQKKDGSWLKFEDYKSKFRGQKGNAQRAWETGEYMEAMRIVEHICMMAMEQDDYGYEEQRDYGEDDTPMQVPEADHYQEHAHNMSTKRLRTEEEVDQRDFFLTRQEDK